MTGVGDQDGRTLSASTLAPDGDGGDAAALREGAAMNFRAME